MNKTLLKTLTISLALLFIGVSIMNTVEAVAISPAEEDNGLSAKLNEKDIRSAMIKVSNWQLKNPVRSNPRDWVWGSYLTGLTEWSKMAKSSRYAKYVERRCKENSWEPYKKIYHADGHIIGSTYLELHSLNNDYKRLAPTKERFDHILGNRSKVSLKFCMKSLERWSWCDALFMAPPVWTHLAVKTGDKKYLDFMIEEFKFTTDYLWDPSENLYFRDSSYFKKREANGKKIFWSRGNGWVFAGLARIMRYLPKDHPERHYFEDIFKKMAKKIASIQQPDGTWHASLLDPKSYPNPETSGTGFFAYGMAWGINNGLLDKATYLPVVKKAWAAMIKAVYPNGRLGWVQPIGADPRKVKRYMTMVYGVGAFLLTGCELLKMGETTKQGIIITVQNPAPGERFNCPVRVTASDLQSVEKIIAHTPPSQMKSVLSNCTIIDMNTLKPVEYQVIDKYGDGKDVEILFQTHLLGKETKRFGFCRTAKAQIPAHISSQESFCRFIPERKDDFAWENNRIGFRMFGPALEKSGEISSGVDIFCKRKNVPLINDFYNSKNYHKDSGKGGDFYKVGTSRGAGGLAYFVGDKIITSKNFVSYKVIDNGPIRVKFELKYAPVKLTENLEIVETKTITLDKGWNLCKYESSFEVTKGKLDDLSKIGIGLVTRKNAGQADFAMNNSWMCYSQPRDENGVIRVGVVLPADLAKTAEFKKGENHIWLKLKPKQKITYYAGASWSYANELTTARAWQAYLKHKASVISYPVKVDVK